MKQKIKNIFSKYKLELEKDEIEKFEKFLEIFIEKNSKINLSAIREKDDIILKHFLDSIILNIFLHFDDNSKILDL
jgi:16S rRNA (guanine527-N7)-methyltransferase